MYLQSTKSVKHNAAMSVNRSTLKKSRHSGIGLFQFNPSTCILTERGSGEPVPGGEPCRPQPPGGGGQAPGGLQPASHHHAQGGVSLQWDPRGRILIGLDSEGSGSEIILVDPNPDSIAYVKCLPYNS
jgi:hypothetical protein